MFDGSVRRFKARVPIKGCLQKYGTAYTELFALVVRIELLRLLLALVAAMDWEVEQMDAKTAFLNGFLKRRAAWPTGGLCLKEEMGPVRGLRMSRY